MDVYNKLSELRVCMDFSKYVRKVFSQWSLVLFSTPVKVSNTNAGSSWRVPSEDTIPLFESNLSNRLRGDEKLTCVTASMMLKNQKDRIESAAIYTSPSVSQISKLQSNIKEWLKNVEENLENSNSSPPISPNTFTGPQPGIDPPTLWGRDHINTKRSILEYFTFLNALKVPSSRHICSPGLQSYLYRQGKT